MKKLMGISVIAMLAVAPAFALPVTGDPDHIGTGTTADSVTANVEPEFALAEANSATDNNAASAGYVKGAYNAAIKAINKVNSNTKTSAGAGLTKSGNKISVDLTSNAGLQTTGEGDAATLGVKAGNGIGLDANGVKVVAKDGAIVVDGSGVTVGLTNNGGIVKNATANTLELKVDDSTVEVNATNGVQVKDGGVTAAKLATDSVTTAKIVDGNVTTAKIADSNVTTAKIADSNVTTAKIADSNVTTAKIANDAVTTAKIADGNVTVAKIATSDIAAGTGTYATSTDLANQGYVDQQIDTAVTNLGMSDYAKKTGVEQTIKNTTLSQGAVTQGLTGALGTGTIVTIMTSWDDDTTSTDVTGVTGIGTLATNVSVAAPTINAGSVEYAEPANP